MPVRFQVDPDFYDHPKTIAISDAAVALWTKSGSFSAAKLTDGFIADDVILTTLRYDLTVADELVRRRLWKRVKGGYRFHEWDARNLTKTRVESDRKADRDRKRNSRGSSQHSAGQNGNAQVETDIVRAESARNLFGFQPESERIPPLSVSVSVSESVSGSGHAAGASEPPPARCLKHLENPDPPSCGRCAESRRRRAQWDAEQSQRTRDAPQCGKHRGQPAHNCGLCRSEALGS